MGVAGWFEDFCGNLVIDKGPFISYRYARITKRLNLEFWGTDSEKSHSLYVGSYGRNTGIRGISDIDIIFQLPYAVFERFNNHYGNGQSALLQEVKKAIEKTYSTTYLKADGQVIQVPFDDGITLEILPAFINKDDSYTHPCTNDGGTWKTTNPRPEIQAIRARNNECNGNLIRLCRMIRAWKNEWNVPIGGLLIDTLAYQFIDSWEYRDKSYLYYDWLCRDFFEWLSGQPSTQEYWRAPGSVQYVYNKGGFQYKAKQCYNYSLAAIEHQSNNQDWSAKQKWREVFGYVFPS